MDLHDLTGPTPAELGAIELEWPLIAAEMDIVHAEALIVLAKHPSELDWRRLRRAHRERLHTLAALLNMAEAATRPTRRLAVAA